jgi:carbon monoxide dehydrogenase subunit G
MLIENEFVVAAPADGLWVHLLDVEKIAPCLPGAELTETIDETSWKGKLNMKFGPVAMSFAGTVRIEERDDAAHLVKLLAKGTEQKGKGAATAAVTSWLEPADNGTLVKMTADITLTGTAAQLSRGLLPEISKRLTQQFADCLQTDMAAETTAGGENTSTAVATGGDTPERQGNVAATRPVGGIRLGLAALWASIVNFFRRLFGGGPPDPDRSQTSKT